MRLPIPLSGEYSSTRVPTSLQKKVNMYRHSTRGYRQIPGSLLFSNISATASGSGRGAINMGGLLYVVIAAKLVSVISDGTPTLISSSIAGSGQVIMETDGVQLVITTKNTIYVYTVAGGLVTVTDVDIEDTAATSAYIDLKFYFDQTDGKFIGSANNDATAFSTDDIAEAESFGDDTIAMYAHNELLYAFGGTSIEPNRSVGTGRPPVARQMVIERGIVGSYAVNAIDNKMYFVDQFTRPNVMTGLDYQPIYTPAIAEEWATYATPSTCSVMTYAYRQQNFIEFLFPSDAVSWLYHETSGTWTKHEDSSSTPGRSVGYVNIYGKILFLDKSAGHIYELSETTYSDASGTFERTLDSGLITSEIYGDPALEGRNMSLNAVWITFDTSAAATVSVSISKNLSTFATARSITLASGRQTIKLTSWGKIREAIIRITTTTAQRVDIVDIAGDFEILEG